MSEILFCDGLPAEDWALKDAERFQRVAKENGVEWTLEEAFKAWETLSLDYDAGWTQMPKDDEGLWATWSNFFARQPPSWVVLHEIRKNHAPGGMRENDWLNEFTKANLICPSCKQLKRTCECDEG